MLTKAEKAAAKAAAERDAKLTTRTRGNHKYHVLRALYLGNKVVLLNIEQAATIVCDERDDAGRVKKDSVRGIHKTNWIAISFEDIRRNALKLGLAQLILINYNAISPALLSALTNSWIEINIAPFLEGDPYEIDGESKTRQGDGQVITALSANLNANSVEFARICIIDERKRK